MNPRVLLEYVPLVRCLLAAHEHPDVARVGSLGEITYLVDELVAPTELEIYSIRLRLGCLPKIKVDCRSCETRYSPMLARTCSEQECNVKCASIRSMSIPGWESIVHLGGFCLVEPPEAPKNASPADQAHWIFDHPRDGWRDDGQRVVETLLAGRDVAELSTEELLLLAKGYNWWGRNGKAFETAKLALARTPHSTEWLSHAQLYARNEYLQDLPGFLTACDTCIAQGIGAAAFWHLLKADKYIDIATGECELEDFDVVAGRSDLASRIPPAGRGLARSSPSQRAGTVGPRGRSHLGWRLEQKVCCGIARAGIQALDTAVPNCLTSKCGRTPKTAPSAPISHSQKLCRHARSRFFHTCRLANCSSSVRNKWKIAPSVRWPIERDTAQRHATWGESRRRTGCVPQIQILVGRPKSGSRFSRPTTLPKPAPSSSQSPHPRASPRSSAGYSCRLANCSSLGAFPMPGRTRYELNAGLPDPSRVLSPKSARTPVVINRRPIAAAFATS